MYGKGYLITLLTAILVLAVSEYVYAAGFLDINGHWAESQVNKWAGGGLTKGYSDGTFKPNKQISRAEFVVLTNRAFGIGKEGIASGFSDVRSNNWYYDDVVAAEVAGYIGGYVEGYFKPDNPITRQEVASILARLLNITSTTEGLDKFTDVAQISDWSRGNIGAVVQEDLMRGMPDNKFMPLKNITRAEAIVSLDRALEYVPGGSKPVEQQSEQETGLQGLVTYNGTAVQNATVRIFKADSYAILKETDTDSDGNFKTILEPGKYDITATTDLEVSFKSNVLVNDQELTRVNLSLTKAAVLKGTLTGSNGKAVKKTTIYFTTYFTTNPTFITETDSGGGFELPVYPNKNYKVWVIAPDNEEHIVMEDELEAGDAGSHNVGNINASFDGEANVVSGSGGGGGGGGSTDSEPALKVNSVTFMVNNTSIKISGANNVFTVDLTGYNDTDIFTALTVEATSNATKAMINMFGITKEITFNQGIASTSVKEILGSLDTGEPGVSLQTLRILLGDYVNTSITLFSDDEEEYVTVNVKLPS